MACQRIQSSVSQRLLSVLLAGGSEVAIAAALFTLSTAAVIPLYTLMLLAPDRPLVSQNRLETQ